MYYLLVVFMLLGSAGFSQIQKEHKKNNTTMSKADCLLINTNLCICFWVPIQMEQTLKN